MFDIEATTIELIICSLLEMLDNDLERMSSGDLFYIKNALGSLRLDLTFF